MSWHNDVITSRRYDMVTSARHNVMTLDGPLPCPRKLEAMTSNTIPVLDFPGFASPNYTQVPDELFDLLMPQLSECELRVLLYVIRRTFGFKRDSDAISLSQLVEGIVTREGQRLDYGAGVARSSAVRAIKGLLEKGVIVATKHSSVRRGNETTTYALRFHDSKNPTSKVATGRRVHHETTPGSMVKLALVSPRNPQETGEQETDFEYSNGINHVDKTEAGEAIAPTLTGSNRRQTSSFEDGKLGAILRYRVRRDVGHDDRAAIGVAVERFAEELGDQAAAKVSISRALNLYNASGVGRDAFVDLLFQAKGEVQDRRKYPGKAPVPRNRMAYFFAVVEDRLGLRNEQAP